MKARIVGKTATSAQENEAGVSSRGEVLTRAFDYDEPAFQNMNAADTAFNFQEPKSGERFVITGVILSGNRDIGVNGAITEIYEAATVTATAVVTTLAQEEVPKGTVIPLIPLNLLTNEGAFINGKCDDTSVRVSFYGYFVPA